MGMKEERKKAPAARTDSAVLKTRWGSASSASHADKHVMDVTARHVLWIVSCPIGSQRFLEPELK
jgi:hypothetical protein